MDQQSEAPSAVGVQPDVGSGVWRLDPGATSVTFDTKAMWLFKVHGTVAAIEGSAVVDEDGQLVEGQMIFDPKRIVTGTPKRDAHLRTADFFDVDKHPTVLFVATSATPIGGHLDQGTVDIDGTLTIADQTRPLTVRAEVRRDGDVTATWQR